MRREVSDIVVAGESTITIFSVIPVRHPPWRGGIHELRRRKVKPARTGMIYLFHLLG